MRDGERGYFDETGDDMKLVVVTKKNNAHVLALSLICQVRGL